jgi:MFS family permease
MDISLRYHLKRNYIVNILDGAFFGFAIGFASFTTVIPLFLSAMTDSAILIGLIPGLHVMGWQLPQLFTAPQTTRLSKFKPVVLIYTIHERVPFLGLALIAFLLPVIGNLPGIIMTYAMVLWQSMGAGLTANPWQNMARKVIPPDYLATFFGLQSSAANLLSSVGAVIAGIILENIGFSFNYVYCFLLCSFWMILSWISLALTIEPAHSVTEEMKNQPPIYQSMRRILSTDRSFSWFLIARMLSQFATMAFAFYTVYAVRLLGMGEVAVGILTSVLMFTQVISNPILGRLADKWSRKNVIVIGIGAATLSALLAVFSPTPEWFYLVMILAGIANTAFWAIMMAYTLEFGVDSDRPTYVGMANSLIAPATIIAPLIGGWVADFYGYKNTFLLSSFAGVLTILVFILKVKK